MKMSLKFMERENKHVNTTIEIPLASIKNISKYGEKISPPHKIYIWNTTKHSWKMKARHTHQVTNLQNTYGT